ncbi:MAG: TIGR02301 family protein, partial [Novosphingobium sp.]|nr:TIGR02301 family protein [Novosphingobium sp.]
IDRGLYDKPWRNSLTRQDSAPDPRAVVDAVARRDQIRVLVDGMTAANDLGFTNAVPAKIVVHSEARPKSIRLGNLTIAFKQTAASKLFWAGRPAMRIVQALHWLRDTMPGDDDQPWRGRLETLLADPAHGPALRADLADGMPALPAWMQDLLRPLIAGEAS